MRNLLPLFTALVVALIVLTIWVFSGDDRLASPPRSGGSEAQPEPRDDATAGAAATNRAATALPTWVTGTPATSQGRDRGPGDLPAVVNELEGLCYGKDPQGCNTIAVKTKLLELRQLLPAMSEAELQAIADHFRRSDQSGFKYHMLVAFRSWCGDPFVDCIEEYYEQQPHLVAEALQYMTSRTPKAAAAFERILEREVDPKRRVMLLSRAAFVGDRSVEGLMRRALDRKGSVDRRIAVAGISRLRTEESRRLLWEIVDGEPEAAVYDLSEEGPEREEMRDLRAHAVIGLLSQGEAEDARKLLQRRAANEEDAVGAFAEEFFVTVRRPELIGDVIDLMARRGRVSNSLLLFLRDNAIATDVDHINSKLAGLELPAADRLYFETMLDVVRNQIERPGR